MKYNKNAEKADFYVSPDGSDDAPGTLEAPFATLAKARQVVCDILRSARRDAIRVLLRGGNYFLSEPLRFGLEDGGSQESTITYAAYPGECPIISGGVPVKNWRRLREEEEPGHLCPAARGRLWVAEVPEKARNARAFFSGLRRLRRARGDGFAPWADDRIPPEDQFRQIRVPSGAIQPWPDLRDAELVVIPTRKWSMNILPLESVDEASGMVRTAESSTYPMGPNRRPETMWVENTLAVLDAPGEWVLSARESRLYYWPESDRPEDDLVLAVLSELVAVTGVADYDGPADEPVCGLCFEGLTFAHTNRFPWYGRSGRGLQHDWEAFDQPTAMVRFRAAERCAVRACRFVAGDGAGVRMDLHARENIVEGCEIEQLGGCGIVLAGYGPGTKDVNRGHIIRNNHIHHIGLTTWHSPGIFVWQSGHNHIVHNHIHHTPYTGVVVSGRIELVRDRASECAGTIRWDEVNQMLGDEYQAGAWHDPARWKDDWQRREPLLHARDNLIAHNDIHHVMLVMRDGNGIYISGAGGGNIVRRNMVHDCPSQYFSEGIRCDDDQHETLIDGNLVFNLGGVKATGIVIKGVNTITHNIMAATLLAEAKGMVHLAVGPLEGTVIRNNIFYATHPEHFFFKESRVHGEGPKGLLRDCDVDGNLYWNVADAEKAAEHLRESQRQGMEQESKVADPLFVAPGRNDYRLCPESPAHELGVRPGDPAEAGIEADAWTFRRRMREAGG